MHVVKVELGKRSYDILIGARLEDLGGQMAGLHVGRKVGVVTNPTVNTLYGGRVLKSLDAGNFLAMPVEIPDGEQYKTLDWANSIYTALLINMFDRRSLLVALGGGVIGDLTGFAAATFMRGIPFIQVPTTLLAMVDSSVGGKTGVNHALGKNMIGAFYQPRLVLMDMDVLKSLPREEFIAGIAEVIKYGVIWDHELFEYLERNQEKIMAQEQGSLGHMISRACEIKADVVSKDEREGGLRAILNYGHTLGHAVETTENYTMRHGEAVAIGMVYVSRFAHRLGLCDARVPERVKALVTSYGLPASLRALKHRPTATELLDVMQVDKKAEDGKVRFVLPKKIGEVVITHEWDSRVLQDLLEED
jgi:3-dehydroquinate synthase